MIFTKGGYALFDKDEFDKQEKNPDWIVPKLTETMDTIICKHRKGFLGWMGWGGSVFQWNPDLKIGFGYVPMDLWVNDHPNFKTSFL